MVSYNFKKILTVIFPSLTSSSCIYLPTPSLIEDYFHLPFPNQITCTLIFLFSVAPQPVNGPFYLVFIVTLGCILISDHLALEASHKREHGP